MKKLTKKQRRENYLRARAKYEAKRHTKRWKNRKKNAKLRSTSIKIKKRRQRRKIPVVISAPENFSLIEKTDEVLKYFKESNDILKRGDNVKLDISKVKNLTPPTLLLLVASINNKEFTRDSLVSGNAPEKDDLAKLFTQSGFYDYVRASGRFLPSKENLLHKEVHKDVAPEVAEKAMTTGIKHICPEKKSFAQLYEILIECMANTNNHANLKLKGECYWWLYVYNFPDKKITSYSFLDLGVGIFKSIAVENYLKIIKGIGLYPNIKIVDDLLAGKIRSREKIDNEIRGSGIPKIVEYSKSKHFKEFYIIANDVIIDLKTGARRQLDNALGGTFLYWEIQN